MTLAADRVAMIRARLSTELQAARVDVVDDSARHAGHAGARAGGGHFNVLIVSDAFTDKSLIERHRMVYAAMGEMMQREIHALSIKALTPQESKDAP